MQQDMLHAPSPKVARTLFLGKTASWLWLALRLYVGWVWLSAGYEKIINPAWIGANAGAAMQGFLTGALTKMSGAHPDVSAWYGFFITHVALPHPALFSYLVAFGEFLIGIALIFGAFVGFAAFMGAFLNFNFMFAGAISINPLLLLIEIFLVAAWRNAGFFGLDRWLLPRYRAWCEKK